MSSRFNDSSLLALGLVLIAFGLTALISRTVFERLPHLEDELAYLYQARIFASGQITIDSPPLERAFWQPFVVDYAPTGQRFGKYTPGWPLLLALGVLLGPAWIINACAAALTVALTYRLGSEIYSPTAGLIAAALVTFSPMALLLNATLMSHTTALTLTTLFLYSYWRIERATAHRWRWGMLAGLALGLLVINRPLTAAAISAPFILWSALRLIPVGIDWLRRRLTRAALIQQLTPFIALSAVTLLISSAIPLFNHAATGDPSANLYTLVWEYDRIGFGEGYGRNGHTIIKGVRHARFDLSLMAADLFGWQLDPITPELQAHLRTEADYWPALGLSFFILPIGLFLGLRRHWLQAWLLIALFWLIQPLSTDAAFLKESAALIWRWLALGAAWMLLPPLIFAYQFQRGHDDPAARWTWLLLAVFAALLSTYLAYWIGSQRYSTRYYFEALSALALIAALPLAALYRLPLPRTALHSAIVVLLGWGLLSYSQPRIDALRDFNNVTGDLIAQIEMRRINNQPLLVIVSNPRNNLSWRSYGELMAVTSPLLNSSIIAAWEYDPTVRAQLLARFPERQAIDLLANGSEWTLPD